jgi:hypothetical protein
MIQQDTANDIYVYDELVFGLLATRNDFRSNRIVQAKDIRP